MPMTSQRPCCYGLIILQIPPLVNRVFTEKIEICRIFLCGMQKAPERDRVFPAGIGEMQGELRFENYKVAFL